MIKHELLRDRGILTVKPDGALRTEDFTALAAAVDPYIEEQGELKGLMVEASSFPGWEDFAAFLSHLRFVRDHQRRIRRVAVLTDSRLLAVAPKIVDPFVSPQLRHFNSAERAAALAWIEAG
jgi:hypothetical protein